MTVYASASTSWAKPYVQDDERVVVKLSNNNFKHEISIYLQDDGSIEARYFREDGTSMEVFTGVMTEDELEIYLGDGE